MNALFLLIYPTFSIKGLKNNFIVLHLPKTGFYFYLRLAFIKVAFISHLSEQIICHYTSLGIIRTYKKLVFAYVQFMSSLEHSYQCTQNMAK